ncbi:hypothetical protein CAP47_02100 [Psychroflexus sp. S27]|nr:hypothetical protein CAP47_02100 [Psychroflexus sp. S27]
MKYYQLLSRDKSHSKFIIEENGLFFMFFRKLESVEERQREQCASETVRVAGAEMLSLLF